MGLSVLLALEAECPGPTTGQGAQPEQHQALQGWAGEAEGLGPHWHGQQGLGAPWESLQSCGGSRRRCRTEACKICLEKTLVHSSLDFATC